MSLELRRDLLPAELDVGHRFFWEGATYRVTMLGTSWVSAEPVGEPGQKPATPAPVALTPTTSVSVISTIPPPEKVVEPVELAEPAREKSVSRDTGSSMPAPAQEAAEPVVEQAPAIDGEKSASRDAGSIAVDAAPIAKPAEVAVEPVEIPDIPDIPNIPARFVPASQADITALVARVELAIWMLAATMVGTIAALWLR